MKFHLIRSWIAITLALLTAALVYKFIGAPLTHLVFDTVPIRATCWFVGTLLTLGLPALVGYGIYSIIMRVGMK